MKVITRTLLRYRPPGPDKDRVYFMDDSVGVEMTGADFREMGRPDRIVVQVSAVAEEGEGS